MITDAIKVESVQEKVYERLRELVISRQLAPGEKISIRQMAEAFGVSTMPVREALRKLEAEGMVTFERNGIVIRQLSAREVEQFFEIRIRLETLGVSWALPNINETDEKRFEELVEEMDNQKADLTKWRELNRQFHLYLYSFAGSAQLQQMIENLWNSVEPYMRLYTSTVTSLEQAQKEHHEVVELIKCRNADHLCKLIAAHLNATAKIILENFDKEVISEE